MEFINILKYLGESILESDKGCSCETFSYYIKLIKYFEYENIAKTIILNSIEIDNRMFCDKTIISQIFEKYK